MNSKQKEKLTTKKYDDSFQLLFELSVQGIIIKNKYGSILDSNEAAHKMFGYNKDEIIGKNIAELVSDDFASTLPKILTKDHLTGDQYIERTFKKKDGTLFISEVCTKHTKLKNEECIIAFIHDVSAQKKIQNELSNSKAELEKVIASRDKFFSIISHDLKSPMQSILGFTELIEENLNNPSKELMMYVENLKKSANSSYELLENLLQWTICQSHNLKPLYKLFDIEETCKENFFMFVDQASKKDIVLKKDIQPSIKINTDKNILQFIVRNLVLNAIKFTPRKGEVLIVVSQTKSHTSFIVKDTGTGIEDNKINKILDPNTFYTTAGTENETGTGLGLKTCIELLKLLGSELIIESKLNKGSIFAFNLPNKPN